MGKINAAVQSGNIIDSGEFLLVLQVSRVSEMTRTNAIVMMRTVNKKTVTMILRFKAADHIRPQWTTLGSEPNVTGSVYL